MMANEDKMKPAPDAARCEAGGGSCGAGQPLFKTGGLIHCAHHASWPSSKEGRIAAATNQINNEKE
jgi:hypothetical protein